MDQQLDAFMDLGPNAAPQRIAQATYAAIRTTSQRRAWWPARRFPTLNTYARLGLVAAAVLAVVIIGIGLFGRSTDVGPPGGTESSAPSISPSALAEVNPLVGTWLAPPVTCAQQTAAVAAAFTPEQMALAWSCTEVDTVQYKIVFDARRPEDGTRHLREFANDGIGWSGVYHVVDGSTFTAGDGGRTDYITYHFAIDGDQLTIDMISDNMPSTSEAELLGEQMAQTAIYETSPFTRQP